MRLEIRTRGLGNGTAAKDYCARRVGFALGRQEGRLGRVVVRLGDVNGPRGGEDKTCQVVMETRSGARVTVEDRDASLNAAIDRALDRAARALARTVDRDRAGWRAPVLTASLAGAR